MTSPLPLLALCATLLAQSGHSRRVAPEVARATCEAVVEAARAEGVPPAVAVMLAWHESKLNPKAKGRGGTRGVLQVTPRALARYGPDATLAGVRTLGRWLRHAGGDVARGVCHFMAGSRCGPKTLKKARLLVRKADALAGAAGAAPGTLDDPGATAGEAAKKVPSGPTRKKAGAAKHAPKKKPPKKRAPKKGAPKKKPPT